MLCVTDEVFLFVNVNGYEYNYKENLDFSKMNFDLDHKYTSDLKFNSYHGKYTFLNSPLLLQIGHSLFKVKEHFSQAHKWKQGRQIISQGFSRQTVQSF